MTLFSVIYRPVSPKRYLPKNSVLFNMDSSAGDIFSLLVTLFQGAKSPCCQFRKYSFPMQLSPRFSLRIYVFYHAGNGDIYLYFAQSHTA